MTRDEIVRALEQDRTRLLAAIEGLPEEDKLSEPIIDRWTIKDLLGHMAMWQKVALQFIDDYCTDGAPKQLGLDSDAAVDEHNRRESERRQGWTLAQVRAELDETHTALVAAVRGLNDQDLNNPLSDPWKDTTLEKLIAINSYTHDPDHIEQIEKWREHHSPPRG